MKKYLFALALGISVSVSAQTELVFVYFNGKPNKAAFYANPLSELTQKSLNRRTALGVGLNDQDAPLENTYVQAIQNLGLTVTDKSKWLNGVAVNVNQAQVNQIKALPFVQSVESFAKNSSLTLKVQNQNKFQEFQNINTVFNYGSGLDQIDQINLKPLHLAGYTGTGIAVAVIDSGFPSVDNGTTFSRLWTNNQIKAGYDFVAKTSNIYEPTLNAHGTLVLGAIAGYVQDVFVGSAPDANFYLYRSENASVEIPEEEMYWIEAAEEADRQGVDLITTSLGYALFDDPKYSYTYSQMNGSTSFIARGAEIAVNKGIFVLFAAGNSGTQPWHYMTTPADNTKVFSIGSVDETGASSPFSSYGPNSAGAIKPDASARGTASVTVNGSTTATVTGTSIAAPIAAGGVACLIQAFPTMNRDTMRNSLRSSASLAPSHTDQMGYGILNFGSFFNAVLNTSELVKKNKLAIFPNPTKEIVNIVSEKEILTVQIYDNLGRIISTEKNKKSFKVSDFAKGTYYLKIQTKDGIFYEKFLKE
ncbi:S8/S53 family peptidase [Chryseobacterium caseinilyticum]|uniref:S8 family peptidase n=1 Tax=Chryseobacterium caseinilyticum TaxID=2771428 RepID=A0ABR8Z820_9FLAO|nr:S8 family serine peptidase [Chryseobacterium caseinilyticum]MBD8081390.1 S8 family peptidase [Chryseobacterium caseinilyticum]